MTAEVDPDVCQGYGVCVQLAPEDFTLDADGYAQVAAGGGDPGRPAVREAAGACPVQAILLGDED